MSSAVSRSLFNVPQNLKRAAERLKELPETAVEAIAYVTSSTVAFGFGCAAFALEKQVCPVESKEFVCESFLPYAEGTLVVAGVVSFTYAIHKAYQAALIAKDIHKRTTRSKNNHD